MTSFKLTFLILSFLVLAWLALYGAHRALMVFLYYKYPRPGFPPPDALGAWPVVTVQLPVYNERHVIERLIDAVCQLDYPPDRLEVQVLDDSTDETAPLAAACVARHRARGVDIHYLHRTERHGYKAGALHEGLRHARGEFIAIFDADFL
ncbi:MAG: glycosyltransferase, partial [Candidatus Latescibacteria bacterium]|nr:glycosyltransferase [Candidatus Latescibacterota bacterium]